MISAVNKSDEVEVDKREETDCGLEEVDVSPDIYFKAISGGINISTFKILGKTRKKSFIILIDSGATHNYIDLTAAAKLGGDLEDANTMIVTLVNGEKAFSKHQCKDFRWKMLKQEFHTSLRVLPLDGCDMVLFMQWLQTIAYKCTQLIMVVTPE